MPSAMLLRPPTITLLMKAWRGRLWCLPSGIISRRGALPRLGIALLRFPCAVLAPAAADQYDRVLLQAVTLPGDVGRDLHRVRQAHAGDLPQGRVRLLRRHG